MSVTLVEHAANPYNIPTASPVDLAGVDVMSLKNSDRLSIGTIRGNFDQNSTLSIFMNAERNDFWVYQGTSNFALGGYTFNPGDMLWCGIRNIGVPLTLISNFSLIPRLHTAATEEFMGEVMLSDTQALPMGVAASGTSLVVSREDHVHPAPGNASDSSDGLMSKEDKRKLESVILSDASPSNLGSASPGTSKEFSRADHTHAAIPLASVGQDGLMSSGDKNKLDSVVPASNQPNPLGLAQIGTSTKYAREDHTHPAIEIARADADGMMSHQDKQKLDSLTVVLASDQTPNALGVASAGTSKDFARVDHVHPATPNASISVDGLMSHHDKQKLDILTVSPVAGNDTPQSLGVATKGTSERFAREDHVHPAINLSSSSFDGLMSKEDKQKLDGLHTVVVPEAGTATPNNPGTASVGTSLKYAREDHTHSSTIINPASQSKDGLMSSTDKQKLDSLTAPPSPSDANPAALGSIASSGSSLTYSRSDHVHPAPPVVSNTVNGLMLKEDKARFDGMLPATANPASASAAPVVGTSTKYAREDHAHAKVAANTPPWSSTVAYLQNDIVVYTDGNLYRANANISVGTTWATGSSGATWSPVVPASLLSLSVAGDYVKPGSMFVWPTATPPAGYLICNGSAVSRVTYLTLFNAIGTLHGLGDGILTFNLPNLTGVLKSASNISLNFIIKT